jgi:uncharacterized membrane protein YtjA (UPF0391 family)
VQRPDFAGLRGPTRECVCFQPGSIARVRKAGVGFQVPTKIVLNKEPFMLYWTLVFLIVALIAGVFGFFGIAGAAMEIARILFFIFLVLFLVAALAGVLRRRPH